MENVIGDTFFVRSNGLYPEYRIFWDIEANVRLLRGLRIHVEGAHIICNCLQDCLRLLPSVGDLRRLQEHIPHLVASYFERNGETTEDINDDALQCLLLYNDFYYRLLEAAARH